MSTRGVVGIGDPSNWRGVYNHWDSYPEGLGCQVWSHLQELLKRDKNLNAIKDLLKFTDWETYLRDGLCPYCGKKNPHRPHTINLMTEIIKENGNKFKTLQEVEGWYTRSHHVYKHDKDMVKIYHQHFERFRKTGFPDPECQLHSHETGSITDEQYTAEDGNPLFIEWVYVIEPNKKLLYILSQFDLEHLGIKPNKEGVIEGRPSAKSYSHCVYEHGLVTAFGIKLKGELDVKEIQKQYRRVAVSNYNYPEDDLY